MQDANDAALDGPQHVDPISEHNFAEIVRLLEYDFRRALSPSETMTGLNAVALIAANDELFPS